MATLTIAAVTGSSGARSYDEAVAFERITIDPGRMGGVPVHP
jgi:hypothetical protein